MKNLLSYTNKSLNRGIIALSLLFLFSYLPKSSLASHNMGGEIGYECLGGNQYLLKLKFYRDCGSFNPLTQNVNVSGCSVNLSVTLDYQSSLEISDICPSQISNSQCANGTINGVLEDLYTGVVTLPSQCADWLIKYSHCCRGGSNIIASSNLYIEAMISNVAGLCNSSPQFTSPPAQFYCVNQKLQYNLGAYDSEGDSLVYTHINPQSNSGVNIPYQSGYSISTPMAVSDTFILDSQTGQISATPNALQSAVITIRVDEYRNGQLIGYSMRDYVKTVINCSNYAPTLSGVNGTSDFSINAHTGSNICFDVFSNDVDAGDTLSVNWNSAILGVSFSSSGGAHPTGTFCWTPGVNDAGTHHFSVTVKDNACTYFGKNTYSYTIHVASPDVWPGDADYDGIVNNFDILAIGTAFGATGPVRPNASILFQPQPAPDWANAFPNGANYKHSDCDGDGIVDFTDTLAVAQNYGLTHAKTSLNGKLVDPQLYLQLLDTLYAGQTVTSPVFFGNSTTPVTDLYGVAFSVNFDNTIVDTGIEVSYQNSWIGTPGVDLLGFSKNLYSNGKVDVAVTRTDQVNQSQQFGKIADITFRIKDDVSGKDLLASQLIISIDNIKAINANSDILSVLGEADTAVIFQGPVGIKESPGKDIVKVYPNPTHHSITLEWTDQERVEQIVLQDIYGRQIKTITRPEGTKAVVEMETLSSGIYFVSLKGEGVQRSFKVVRM